jgi:hypothetical protein
LSTGEKFLRRFETKPSRGRVLYVNLEMPEGLLRQWIRDAGGDLTRIYIWDLRGLGAVLDVRSPATRAELGSMFESLGIDTMVMDTIGGVWDTLGAPISEKANEEVGPYLGGLDALLAETPLTELFLIHHYGHGPERARGASKLLGWPDSLWDYKIDRPTGEEDDGDASRYPRFLTARGRDVALPESKVDFSEVTRRLSMPADAKSKAVHRRTARLDEVGFKVLLWLDDHSAWGDRDSKKKVEIGVGGKAVDVREALAELVRSGLVEIKPGPRHSQGVELTDLGRQKMAWDRGAE